MAKSVFTFTVCILHHLFCLVIICNANRHLRSHEQIYDIPVISIEDTGDEAIKWSPPPSTRSSSAIVSRAVKSSDGSSNSQNARLLAQSNVAVVEVAIVCDKEFGDLFQHDRQKIIDYWSIYFWDITMRFKTLPSSDISFRITSVVMIATRKGQPFIEYARNENSGVASLDRIKPLFASWIFDKIESFPKFDIAIAVTNTDLEGADFGSKGYFEAACQADYESGSFYGSFVVSENRGFKHVQATTQGIALLLGAPWDANVQWCKDQGYIQSMSTFDKQYFFSSCSDQHIYNFIRSDKGACLREIDEVFTFPQVDPDYNTVLAPSIEFQCNTLVNDPDATLSEDPNIPDMCQRSLCQASDSQEKIELIPVDNTDCHLGRRCFRGRCREHGLLLKNVGSGQCLLSQDKFVHNDVPVLAPCPRTSTPLDRFVVLDEIEYEGRRLTVPFSSDNGLENSDKCMFGLSTKSLVQFDRCNASVPVPKKRSPFEWDFIDMKNGEFLLSHGESKMCARQVGGRVRLHTLCDNGDSTYRWKFEKVLPSDGMCGSKNKCEADLNIWGTFKNISESSDFTNRSAVLEIELTNLEGIAISPAVIVSWNRNLRLKEVPYTCLPLPPTAQSNMTTFKCKLDKLLQKNEKALVASLNFTVAEVNASESSQKVVIKMTPSTVSRMIRQETKSLIYELHHLKPVEDEKVKGKGSSLIWVVLGSVIGTLAVVAGGALAFYWFYIKKKYGKRHYGIWTDRIKQNGGSSAPPAPSLEMARLKSQTPRPRSELEERRYQFDDPPHLPPRPAAMQISKAKSGSIEEHLYEEIQYGSLLYDEDNYLAPLPDRSKTEVETISPSSSA